MPWFAWIAIAGIAAFAIISVASLWATRRRPDPRVDELEARVQHLEARLRG